MESKELEQKLFHSQKLESLGNFAGGIAHDFNNILTAILGYTDLSLNFTGDSPVLKRNPEMIYNSAERAAELVSQILSFARRSEMKIEPVRPDLILMEVLKFIRSSTPTTIKINHRINFHAFIMGNNTHLHQIFMNLITNSTHAMKKNIGSIHISMDEVQLEEGSFMNENIASGKYIRIVISDTGEGIPPENLHVIFDPYFSTKERGKGTGLGLAVVHGIIESYKGDIRVESTIGVGTEFIIHIPETEKRQPIEREEDDGIPSGDERILLVDDEPSIVETGQLILSRLGYNVMGITDSLKALEEFEKAPDDYDLVITDMMMPDMNGVILSAKIRNIKKEIPIIICSGYDKESSVSKNELHLNKPFTKKEIAREVRMALDSIGN